MTDNSPKDDETNETNETNETIETIETNKQVHFQRRASWAQRPSELAGAVAWPLSLDQRLRSAASAAEVEGLGLSPALGPDTRRGNGSGSGGSGGSGSGGSDGLHPEDALHERELLCGVWHLLRSGRVDDARELCRRQGQHWRAATIAGAQPLALAGRGGRVRSGNANRALWKTCCWSLVARAEGEAAAAAAAASPALSRFHSLEAAVYAAAAADLPAMLRGIAAGVACGDVGEEGEGKEGAEGRARIGGGDDYTWEHALWAHLVSIRERRRDEALARRRAAQVCLAFN